MTRIGPALLLSLVPALAAVARAQHGDDHPHAHSHARPDGDFGIEARTLATIRALSERVAANPADTLALGKLGGLQLEVAKHTGEHTDLTTAEATFRRLLALDPSSDGARIGLAYSLLGRHEIRAALAAARTASHRLPDHFEVLALLGDAHFALGNYAEAEAFYRRLVSAETTLQSLARMSLVHELRGRFDEADKALEQALQAGAILGAPAADRAWCETMRGELALSSGLLDPADEHFQEALAIDPRCHAAAWRLAQVQIRRGDEEAAREALLALVASYPKPTYWIALGDACAAAGRDEEAASWYARAEADMLHDVDHGDLGHVRELVELWLARGREIPRAVELAQLDLVQVRQDVGAFETAAWALHAAGRHDEALEHIMEALQRSGGSARTLWRAATIHAAAGREPEARLLFARASRRNPLYDEAW